MCWVLTEYVNKQVCPHCRVDWNAFPSLALNSIEIFFPLIVTFEVLCWLKQELTELFNCEHESSAEAFSQVCFSHLRKCPEELLLLKEMLTKKGTQLWRPRPLRCALVIPWKRAICWEHVNLGALHMDFCYWTLAVHHLEMHAFIVKRFFFCGVALFGCF